MTFDRILNANICDTAFVREGGCRIRSPIAVGFRGQEIKQENKKSEIENSVPKLIALSEFLSHVIQSQRITNFLVLLDTKNHYQVLIRNLHYVFLSDPAPLQFMF